MPSNGQIGRRFTTLNFVYGFVLAGALWMTIDLDHPVRRGTVAPQSRQPFLEARSIVERRRRERGHPLSVAIACVLEEHAEITIFEQLIRF